MYPNGSRLEDTIHVQQNWIGFSNARRDGIGNDGGLPPDALVER